MAGFLRNIEPALQNQLLKFKKASISLKKQETLDRLMIKSERNSNGYRRLREGLNVSPLKEERLVYVEHS